MCSPPYGVPKPVGVREPEVVLQPQCLRLSLCVGLKLKLRCCRLRLRGHGQEEQGTTLGFPGRLLSAQ